MRFQERKWSCGSSAVVNCLRCYGIKVPERRVRSYSGTTEEHGADEFGIKDALNSLGFVAHEYTSPKRIEAVTWLTGALVMSQPCILCVDSWSHWVTVVGKIGDRFIIIDPANTKTNKSENGIHIVSKKQLTRRWASKDNMFYAIAVTKSAT